MAERLRNGDDGAMREFYAQYADYLAGICSRYIVEEDDMKDVFQDALVHIITHISDFRFLGTGSLKAWTTKIVVNQSLRFLRTKKQHELLRLEQDVADEQEEDPPIFDVPPEVIHQMVSRLPTGYRTVFNLYVFEDKSHSEIADLLGIEENTSSSQLHRARRLLAKMIEQYHNKM